MLRSSLVVMVGTVLLGCSGISEQVQALVNAQMQKQGGEVNVGDVGVAAGQKVPDGFPLAAPDGATVQSAVQADLGGMKSSTVVWQMDGDAKPTLDKYEQTMKDAGLTTTRTDDALVGTSDKGDNWAVSVTDMGGKKQLSVVVTSTPK